jgi:hypothetical protein
VRAASLGQLSLVDGDGAAAALQHAALRRSATALWAWLPIELRATAEGAWVEGRYVLVTRWGRPGRVLRLAGGPLGWRAPDNCTWCERVRARLTPVRAACQG